MNNEGYDQQRVECLVCKHRWILISDKKITDDQFDTWVKQVAIQHEEIRKELEDKNV